MCDKDAAPSKCVCAGCSPNPVFSSQEAITNPEHGPGARLHAENNQMKFLPPTGTSLWRQGRGEESRGGGCQQARVPGLAGIASPIGFPVWVIQVKCPFWGVPSFCPEI